MPNSKRVFAAMDPERQREIAAKGGRASHRYIFECIISREIFERGGYREDETDRTIYFLWKPRGQMQFRL